MRPRSPFRRSAAVIAGLLVASAWPVGAKAEVPPEIELRNKVDSKIPRAWTEKPYVVEGRATVVSEAFRITSLRTEPLDAESSASDQEIAHALVESFRDSLVAKRVVHRIPGAEITRLFDEDDATRYIARPLHVLIRWALRDSGDDRRLSVNVSATTFDRRRLTWDAGAPSTDRATLEQLADSFAEFAKEHVPRPARIVKVDGEIARYFPSRRPNVRLILETAWLSELEEGDILLASIDPTEPLDPLTADLLAASSKLLLRVVEPQNELTIVEAWPSEIVAPGQALQIVALYTEVSTPHGASDVALFESTSVEIHALIPRTKRSAALGPTELFDRWQQNASVELLSSARSTIAADLEMLHRAGLRPLPGALLEYYLYEVRDHKRSLRSSPVQSIDHLDLRRAEARITATYRLLDKPRGFLEVSSIPEDAVIRIEGTRRGYTNRSFVLSPGSYTIQVVSAASSLDCSKTVEIRADETTPVRCLANSRPE
ncbi:MAG: PEGA domain-containing protein [Acidobacteriota bacterium]